ncbi:MAG: CorA family divalent cation transporter, partial [Alphaproteobacteria bacterium]
MILDKEENGPLLCALWLKGPKGAHDITELQTIEDLNSKLHEYEGEHVWIHLNLDFEEAAKWFEARAKKDFGEKFELKRTPMYEKVSKENFLFYVGALSPPERFVDIELLADFEKLPEMSDKREYDEFINTLYTHELHHMYFLLEHGKKILITAESCNTTFKPMDDWSLKRKSRPQVRDILRAHRRKVRLHRIHTLAKETKDGDGPDSVQECVFELIGKISSNTSETLVKLEHVFAAVEDYLFDAKPDALLHLIASLRSRVTRIYKQVVPLRDVISAMREDKSIDPILISDKLDKRTARVRDAVEDIENLRLRITTLQEAVAGMVTVRLTRYAFLLTIVATISLPLTVVASMYGANVLGTHQAAQLIYEWIVRISPVELAEMGEMKEFFAFSVMIGFIGFIMIGVLWFWWRNVRAHFITPAADRIHLQSIAAGDE